MVGGLRLHTAASANSSHHYCGDTQPRRSLYTSTPREITAASAFKFSPEAFIALDFVTAIFACPFTFGFSTADIKNT